MLVEEYSLDGIVQLPQGILRYATGVTCAILLFSGGNKAGTSNVWFYDFSWDDDAREDQLRISESKTKPGWRIKNPSRFSGIAEELSSDVIARWNNRNGSELKRGRLDRSFCVPKAEIATHGYDLMIDRYRASGDGTTRSAKGTWRLGDIAEVFSGSVAAAQLSQEDSPDGPIEKRVLHPSLLSSLLPDIEILPVNTGTREPKLRLTKGDIVGRDLAANRNWSVLPSGYEGVQAGQGILVVRLRDKSISAEYVAAYLSSSQAEREFPKYGVIPRIRRAGLLDIMIPACDGDAGSIRAAISRLSEGALEAVRIQEALQESKAKIFEAGTPAKRRATLEKAADFSSLIAQNLRRQSEPYKVFQETYPYSTARAVRKFVHSISPAEKHEAALQCAESLVLSLGIFSLAQAANSGRQQIPDVDRWMMSVSQGGVSLGEWVGVIRAVGADARENGEAAGGLAEATAPVKGGKGLLADLGELVNRRNKIRHGAGPRTRAEIDKSLEGLEHLIFSSLSSSTFLARNRWVYVDRLRWMPSMGKYQVLGLALMGDHPDFEPFEFQSDLPLADDSLYILTRQNEIIPIFPFCVLSDCPACLAPELYYPDRLTRKTALLKSLDRGHELENEAIFEALSTSS
jgi:type I restriction enzyme M protein